MHVIFFVAIKSNEMRCVCNKDFLLSEYPLPHFEIVQVPIRILFLLVLLP